MVRLPSVISPSMPMLSTPELLELMLAPVRSGFPPHRMLRPLKSNAEPLAMLKVRTKPLVANVLPMAVNVTFAPELTVTFPTLMVAPIPANESLPHVKMTLLFAV